MKHITDRDTTLAIAGTALVFAAPRDFLTLVTIVLAILFSLIILGLAREVRERMK